MSHTVTIKATEMKNPQHLQAACRRLNLAEPQLGLHTLFDRSKHNGYAVQLPDWRYPVIVDTESGKCHFDDYNGQWGKEEELDRLVQAYTIELAEAEARANGYGDISEEVLADGTVKVLMHSY